MADQCIVCLDNLDVQLLPPAQLPLHPDVQSSGQSTSATAAADGVVPPLPTLPSPLDTTTTTTTTTTTITSPSAAHDDDNRIAVIQVCGHVLHDACLREWTGKANSCPICRQAFHLVHVYDKVGGTEISSYKVEDKKQVVEFDPQVWLDEQPDDEEWTRPCPICDHTDHEDVLLLCDSCDAPYHTYCVGLDSVPRGHWFCLECSEQAAGVSLMETEDPDITTNGLAGFTDHRSGYLPRTQASMRRARQRARSDEWQGAWGQIAGRVYDALNIDLDNHDDEDEVLHTWRRTRQRGERERERERREADQRWQQRINIASRLGARDVFATNLLNVIPPRAARRPAQPPPPPQETPEEKQAWGALERAMEVQSPERPATNHRKRKSRSVTASPVEPPPQQERKLKRPRTRRCPTQNEPTTSTSAPGPANQSTSISNGESSSAAASVPPTTTTGSSAAPTFLSSLLKEVEMSTPSDDENVRAMFGTNKATTDASSPVTSPSLSAMSSPRALSTTPPPRGIGDRPGSPLSLSSHIKPIYPPAKYSGSRSTGEHSDSESRPRPPSQQQQNGASRSPELRQPRPQRQQRVDLGEGMARSQNTSPTRSTSLPFEMKESISGIVKCALKPHWQSGQLSAEQYASINRDLSHKLYKEVSELALDNEARNRFEKIATKEVARAVADLRA